MTIIEKYRHPVIFYALATLIPWTFWFLAAYLSHMTPTVAALAIIGICAPACIASLQAALMNFSIPIRTRKSFKPSS